MVDPVVQKWIDRRKELGMSHSALATAMGVSQSTISHTENGETSPLLNTLRKAFKVLGLEIEIRRAAAPSLDVDISFLKSLEPGDLEAELLKRKWYVYEDDLVGGYSVMPVDAPPSSGCFSVADFTSRDSADHVVFLHNKNVAIRNSVAVEDGRDLSCVARWPECSNGGYDPKCCRFPKSCSC